MTHSSQNRPVAMVTGASSGIGRAIACRLAAEGYDLAICARREELLSETAVALAQRGADVFAQAVDLRDESQILSFFTAVQAKWNRLDALINNAGLGHKASLMSGKTDAWREMLDVNVLALFICTREAVQMMHSVNSGHIVHVSSMSGHRVPTITGIYSATKFAVRAHAETLRRELRAAKSHIRITAISPGIVETEFAEKYHGSAQKAQETYEQFQVLTADDIANAVVYALSQPDSVEVNDILLRPRDQAS
ncbi:MAG: SDR family NAD(P)-dependent oxidoreductase [Cyanobacteria bacterium P01_D01_bin.105]